MLAQTEATLDGPLTIDRTRYGDDVLVLTLAGELDLAVTSAAAPILGAALAEPCAMVVLDLTELELIDPSGIALLYALGRSRADKETLRLLPSRHPGVNRLLELTAVGSVFPIVAAFRPEALSP